MLGRMKYRIYDTIFPLGYRIESKLFYWGPIKFWNWYYSNKNRGIIKIIERISKILSDIKWAILNSDCTVSFKWLTYKLIGTKIRINIEVYK